PDAEGSDHADDRPLLDAAFDLLLRPCGVLARAPAQIVDLLERFLAFLGAEIAHRAAQRLQVLTHLVDLAAKSVDIIREVHRHVISSRRRLGCDPGCRHFLILTPTAGEGIPVYSARRQRFGSTASRKTARASSNER